ncbi:hypothetical protein EMPS_05215 [Entomortierella parvispora]|uniref:Uncharacterized protein n=1 Tax=Entomortierella parvispora TaxID=205924 RepID=A0A9P3HAQ1_9FUNG|nr:hypothetical protein EMPS_05215 [Entomortierella parvispora]
MAARQEDSIAQGSTQDGQEGDSGSLTGGQITAENVKNFKRKVISIAKLKEVFEKKEQELSGVKNELKEEQQKNADIQSELTHYSITKAELKQTATLLAKHMKIAEQLKVEAEAAKLSQGILAKSLEEVTQRSKVAEIARAKLEHNTETSKTALENLKAEYNKLLHRSNAVKNELTATKGDLMRSKAEIGEKRAWLAEQKALWEQDESNRHAERTKELTDKLKELEHQLEDTATEHEVEMGMTQEDLRNTKQELMDAQSRLETLEQTISDLRSQNAELEQERHSKEDHTNPEMDCFEEFEEFVPEIRKPALPTVTTAPLPDSITAPTDVITPTPVLPASDLTPSSPAPMSVSTRRSSKSKDPVVSAIPVARDVNQLPGKQLEEALRTMEDLKAQFSMLSWIHGTQTGSQRMEALESQVKILLKEKQALQDELTRVLVSHRDDRRRSVTFHPGVATSPPTSVVASVPSPQVPTAADTVASPTTPKEKRGRKRKVEEADSTTTQSTGKAGNERELFSPELDGPNFMSEDEAATVPIHPKEKKSRATKSPAVAVEQKSKRGRKPKAVSSSNSFADLEIRNISLNPLVPLISEPMTYFSSVMDSPIVHDSGPFTKMNVMAKSLPQHLNALCQAVVRKSIGLAKDVAAYRQSRDITKDDTEDWNLDGYKTMSISNSLEPQEINIVQLVCLLGSASPTINVPKKVVAFLYDSILQKAASGESLEGICVLVRVLVGICRTEGDIRLARVLSYDLLRELDRPKHSLILSEAIASIWPDVFKVAEYVEKDDPSQFLLKAMQGSLGTLQEMFKNEEISFGFNTFTKKCGWPALEDAPFLDELAKEVMDIVRSPQFVEKCSTEPGFEFTIRKTLELVFIQGYEWIEVFTDFIKPEFLAMVLDPSRHTFAIPLIASVTREARFGSSSTSGSSTKDDNPVRQVFEAILASEATVQHQVVSALALVSMSNGQVDRLEKTKLWFQNLDQGGKITLPEPVRTLLEAA